MIFYKTVTCGNDFIHVETDEYQSGIPVIKKEKLVQCLCSRHSGAGADGVIFYKIGPNTQKIHFEIFNRDGSEAELSGNGMAGLSALFFYLDKANGRHVVLDTKAGLKKHTLLHHDKNKFHLKIEISTADFQNRDFFPFLKKDQANYHYKGVTFYPVSVGNPHVVILLEGDFPGEKLEQTGKMFAAADIFPFKTNVELVLPIKPGVMKDWEGDNFRVFYYERGVGPTHSSSTGSAAVFAVLQKLDLIKETLIIPFGDEKIKISGKNEIYIENYTEIVYKGIYFSA